MLIPGTKTGFQGQKNQIRCAVSGGKCLSALLITITTAAGVRNLLCYFCKRARQRVLPDEQTHRAQ
jgi:hypothetical protein